MKKYILLLSIFIGSNSFAQTIQNNGFETWTNLLFFFEPQGYVTSNYASLLLGGGGLPRANVSRSTTKYAGTYSAKLESYAQNTGDTTGVPGIMITGELDLNNVTIKPGIAISGGRPDELRGFYKYAEGNLPDSGIISVALTKYDPLVGGINVIGGGLSVFSNKTNFTSFSVPILYATSDVPDTAIIIISTTSVFSLDTSALTSAPVGSILYVDELSFFSSTSGLQPVDKLIEASLYPNPSTDFLNVEFVQKNASEVEVKLITIDGKTVYSSSQFLNEGLQNVKIAVNDFEPGIYQLSVQTLDGKISKRVSIIK